MVIMSKIRLLTHIVLLYTIIHKYFFEPAEERDKKRGP